MKGIPEMMVKTLMSLCEEATTKIKVGYGYSLLRFRCELMYIKDQNYCCFLFAAVIYVITVKM